MGMFAAVRDDMYAARASNSPQSVRWARHGYYTRCGRRTVDREARERADRVLLNVHARAVHEPYERGDALSGGNGDLVRVCGANA